MSRYKILHEIQALDPEAEHERIVFLSTCYDFPFDTTRSLEFALFRTFSVPSISALLDRTGEFRKRAQKRYDDTDIIISEMLEWGYSSDRGRRALERMNAIHGRFKIANADFLYVLSTFVFEPIRWNERFGWRPMCEQERLGMFYFWREVGLRMKIEDLPQSYEAFERFNLNREREHFQYRETNRRVSGATVELFVGWAPRVLAPVVRPAIHALLDDPVLHASGIARPPGLLRWLVPRLLRVRARIAGLLPPRRRPRLRTDMKRPTYPAGYTIETLGPGRPAER